MRRWLVLAVVTASVVAGCGGSSTPKQSSDVQAVSKVVKSYLSQLAAGNGPAACKLMTKSYQGKIVSGSPGSCAKALSTVAYNLGSSEKATLTNAVIARAKVSGEKASVYVKGQKGAAELVKQSGHWLISGGTAG